MVEPAEQLCPVSQTVKPGTPTDDDSEKLDIDLRIHRKRLSKLLDEAHHQLEVNMCDKFKRWKQEKAKEPERPEEESKSEYMILISGAPGVGKSTFSKALLAKSLDCFLADITVETLWAVEQDEPLCPEDMPSTSPGAKQKLISGVYCGDRDNNSIQVLKMEHSALQGPNSQWNLEVKYRVRENKTSAKPWVNIWNFYPDAKVELKQNEIELAISSPNEDHEFAVFGTPEKEDKKRMQMAIFGEKPKQGKHWPIFVTLFDDTTMAFERLCEREESKGRQLLTTLAGLFVSNSDEDIKIDITALEDGWKIIGSHLMKIKSKDAWNSPENSTDFPWCVFEIAHVDKTKQTFVCGIQASHLNDTAETELLALFEQEEENEEHLNSQNFIPPPELTITEVNFIALDKLADATRNDWESPARALTFNGGKKGGFFDLLLNWKQEQTEAFVFSLMLVFFVGCRAATCFVTPHLLEGAFCLLLMVVHNFLLCNLFFCVFKEEENVEALEKARTPETYDLGKLADATRNGWESLARALALEPLEPRIRFKKPKISLTDRKIGGRYYLLLTWELKLTGILVFFPILDSFVRCLKETRFVTPHLSKVEVTAVAFIIFLMLVSLIECLEKPNISFTDGIKGGMYNLLLRWKQEQTDAFIIFLMLVPLIECLEKPNISFTDGKKGGLYNLLLRWKEEQTEAFVFSLMLVIFVGCLAATCFITPHLWKVEETAETFVFFLMLVFFVGCLTGTRFVTPHLLKVEEAAEAFVLFLMLVSFCCMPYGNFLCNTTSVESGGN